MIRKCFLLAATGAVSAACSMTPGSSIGDFVIEQHEVFILESFPMQLQLDIAGKLPDACHTVGWEVDLASETGRIDVSVFASLTDLEGCSQDAKPFRRSIDLGNYTGGEFSIWLNGALISQVNLGEPQTEPDTGVSVDSDNIPTPVADDEQTEDWIRGAAFVDSVEILLLESYPVQVRLQVTGSLPTPCHKLAWDQADVTEDGQIKLELYSLADPKVDCIQILQAFEESIPVGSYTAGEFEVWLNGELIGEFEV